MRSTCGVGAAGVEHGLCANNATLIWAIALGLIIGAVLILLGVEGTYALDLVLLGSH